MNLIILRNKKIEGVLWRIKDDQACCQVHLTFFSELSDHSLFAHTLRHSMPVDIAGHLAPLKNPGFTMKEIYDYYVESSILNSLPTSLVC